MRALLIIVAFLTIIPKAFTQDRELRLIESRSNVNLKFKTADSLFNVYLETDLVKASVLAKRLLALSEESGSRRLSIKAFHAMSMVAGYQGDYATSILYGQKYLDKSIEESDSVMMMTAYINQGDNYLELGRFDLAYFYTYKAQEVAIRTGSLLDEAYAIHNFGRIFKELAQFDIAIENFKRSDSISMRLNDLQSSFYTAWEMGDLYQRQGKNDLAYSNLRRALKLSRELRIRVLQPDVQLDLAEYFIGRNEFDVARNYYDSALILFRDFKNLLGEAKVNLGYGRIKLKQGKSAEAKSIFMETLKMAEELNARGIQIAVYDELSQLAEAQGDYRSSLKYYKNFTTMRDSLFGRELLDQTFRYQLKTLSDAKDNEIKALHEVNAIRQEELSQQHLMRNIIVVVFVLTIGMLYLVYRSNRKNQQINKLLLSHQDELERRSKELEELNRLKDKFFSIISHDLRSPINSLAGVLNLMEKNGVTPQELPELTKELRMQFNHTKNLITNLLSWAMLQMDKISVKKEGIELRKIIDENFALAATMTSKKMNLVNDVLKGTLIFADLNMVHLIIRNLVMNAIKFTDPGGQVRVSAETRGSEV
ncbi:MAG: tetratricopeptide repeat-containing sensor histidine kinase, partial [Cyclobacteriaceae bacterium]